MWPPSTPIRAAILPCLCAARTSSAVVASTRSPGCLRTCSRTASICTRARFTASGPVTLLGIQMEKKIAPRPPSFMRGMSMLPLASRGPRSNLPSRKRCVVSSCVSTTIDKKCSFRARAAMSSAVTFAASKQPAETHKPAVSMVRSISPRIFLLAHLACDVIGQSGSAKQRHKTEIEIAPERHSAFVPTPCAFRSESLPYQPPEQSQFPGLAIHFGNRFGQRNFLGTCFNAILGVRAVLDAAVAHHAPDALFRVHRARGMHVEQAHLADDCRADEIAVRIDLGTHFQTIAAGDAPRKRIRFLLHLGRHAGAFAEVVRTVDGDPRLDAFEALEHELSVDAQISDHWKFRKRLDADGLIELIYKGGTRHASPAVDEHGARAADLFEAVGLVADWSGLFAAASDRVFGDVAQANDDVHRGPPLQRELFPARGVLGAALPLYSNDHLLGFSHATLLQRAKFHTHLAAS